MSEALKPEYKALIVDTLGEDAVPFLATFGYGSSVRVTAEHLNRLLDAARVLSGAGEEPKAWISDAGRLFSAGMVKAGEPGFLPLYARPVGQWRPDREVIIAAIDAKVAEVKAARLEMGFDAMSAWRPLYSEEIADAIIGLQTAPTGWVVTNGAGDQFRSWDSMGSVWVSELKEATFYARRIDAETVHAEDLDAWHVVERPLP